MGQLLSTGVSLLLPHLRLSAGRLCKVREPDAGFGLCLCIAAPGKIADHFGGATSHRRWWQKNELPGGGDTKGGAAAWEERVRAQLWKVQRCGVHGSVWPKRMKDT